MAKRVVKQHGNKPRWARWVSVLASVAAVSAIAAYAAVPPAQSRVAVGLCTAYALTPWVDFSGRTGQARGGANSCDPTGDYFSGNLDLRNNAGTALKSISISGYGNAGFVTPSVGCAGATVHSFTYVNSAGRGSSDNSGTVSGC
jgi:hypothetical protein